MARITHLISERSLHSYHGCARRIGHRKKPPYLQPAPNVMWKRRTDVSSHHKALSALLCLTRFVLVFVQHGVSTNFTRPSPAELNYFKAGPVHGTFAHICGPPGFGCYSHSYNANVCIWCIFYVRTYLSTCTLIYLYILIVSCGSGRACVRCDSVITRTYEYVHYTSVSFFLFPEVYWYCCCCCLHI